MVGLHRRRHRLPALRTRPHQRAGRGLDPRRLSIRTLSSLLCFGALSAFIGTIIAIPAKGAGFPLEYLEHTPFDSFVVPGLILGIVVGGTQLLVALAVRAHRSEGMLLSAVAGFGMLIWIFAELALIGHYHWLQTVYFILGTLELMFVFALLGIRPSVVAPLGVPVSVTRAKRRQPQPARVVAS